MDDAKRVAGRALFATAAVLAVGIALPFDPLMPAPDLDLAWMQALGYAATHGWSFGRDIAFTYGPIGFLQPQAYWPGLYPAIVAYWSATVLVAVRLAYVVPGELPEAWIARAGLLLLIAVGTIFAGGDVLACLAVLALVAVLRKRIGKREAILYCALLGVAGLVKFTALVLGATTALAMDVLHSLERRRLRANHVGAFAATYVVLWLALGQPLGDLADYLLRAMHLASGYAGAMASPGPAWEAAGAWLLAAAVLVLAWRVAADAGRMRRLAYVTTIAALTLLSLKHGLTRHDTHASIFFYFAAVTVVAQGSALPAPARYAGFAVATSIAFLLVTMALHWDQPPTKAFRLLAWRVSLAPDRIAELIRNPELFAQRFRQAQREIARRHPVPDLPGTVDVYGSHQHLVFAHGLTWRARPVIQSYSAYDAFLLELNRDHLRTQDAPDHILFALQPIDERFPAFEDSLSWPDLLARYRLRGVEGPYAVLDRREQPRGIRSETAGSVTSDDWIAVPNVSRALVFAQVAAHTGFAARLRALAYKPAPLWLEVRLDSSRAPARYRFVPAIARAGFLASPLVTSTDAFAALFCAGTDGAATKQPIAFRVADGSGNAVPLTADFVAYRIEEVADAGARTPACRGGEARLPVRPP